MGTTEACFYDELGVVRLLVNKTLRYRLEQIRSLTGLDLSKHSARVRADLALQLLEATRSES